MIGNDRRKRSEVFHCNFCDYTTSRISQYNRHLLTDKHKMIINGKKKVPKLFYECECGKKYKYDSGLSRHKKKCNGKMELLEPQTEQNIQELIVKLITDNQEMKKENQDLIYKLIDQQNQITELIPKIGNNNCNNTFNNKQRFNINVFLNEQCKDALTMQEFVDQIEVSMKNLLTTRDKGLGEGLASIIMDNMNKLSLYKRPIHCTDKKRETVYIKNEEWEKDEKKEQLNRLVRTVENKQMKNINQWIEENPDYMESDKLQEEYINLIRGCTSSIDACKDKVIRKVCDNVYLTKSETPHGD